MKTLPMRKFPDIAKDQAEDLIAVLEEAEKEEGKDADLYVSSFFWSLMKVHLLFKSPDVTQETDDQTGQVGTWRTHKLFLKRTAGILK